jgi:hypothetical protein
VLAVVAVGFDAVITSGAVFLFSRTLKSTVVQAVRNKISITTLAGIIFLLVVLVIILFIPNILCIFSAALSLD